MAKDEFENGNSSRLWVIAAACAIALHAGCVALALGRSSAESDDAFGAPAIEVGLELLATSGRRTKSIPSRKRSKRSHPCSRRLPRPEQRRGSRLRRFRHVQRRRRKASEKATNSPE